MQSKITKSDSKKNLFLGIGNPQRRNICFPDILEPMLCPEMPGYDGPGLGRKLTHPALEPAPRVHVSGLHVARQVAFAARRLIARQTAPKGRRRRVIHFLHCDHALDQL